MKTVGIIGSGIVAKTLGQGFSDKGYSVMLGTRDTSKLAEWSKAESIQTGSFEEAANFAQLIVLAVKGTAAMSALKMIEGSLSGKTIIDTTNPIAEEAPEEGVLKFFTDQNTSLMESLQSAFPQANFVKAFNSVGSALMVNPDLESKPSMFICGDDESSKKNVTEILDQFGWETEDMGKAQAARAIEPLCMLWCIPGFRKNQWMHAFKLIK